MVSTSASSRLMIIAIGKRAIAENQYQFSSLFLANFKTHIESHKETATKLESRQLYYRDYLFSILFQLLLEFEETDDSNEKEYTWSLFPAEWKITKKNLENKKNVIAYLSLHEFLQWALGRISQQVDFDKVLNDMALFLFPEVDAKTWATILTFVLSPYDSSNRVKSVIEKRWVFGLSFSPFVYSFSMGEKIEDKIKEMEAQRKEEEKTKIQNAYELAALLFPNILIKENLDKFIEEATNTEYQADSIENDRKLDLLKVFTDLRDLSKKPTEKNNA